MTSTQIALRHAMGEIDQLLDNVRQEIRNDKIAAATALNPAVASAEPLLVPASSSGGWIVAGA